MIMMHQQPHFTYFKNLILNLIQKVFEYDEFYFQFFQPSLEDCHFANGNENL